MSPVGYDMNVLFSWQLGLFNLDQILLVHGVSIYHFELFTQVVSFISVYHGNISVLVHPNFCRLKMNHLLNAFWIKSILRNLSFLFHFHICLERKLSDCKPSSSHRIFKKFFFSVFMSSHSNRNKYKFFLKIIEFYISNLKYTYNQRRYGIFSLIFFI